MALTDDGAAHAAATLTAAVVAAGGIAPAGKSLDETIAQVMDAYRRSLNVIRKAADTPRAKK